jgi:uncharacterized protein YjbI with pentapeptide repeats
MEVLKANFIIQGDETRHYQNKFIKIITAGLAFKLDQPDTFISENEFVQLWQEVGQGQALDDHLPKTLSEVLVLGKFVAPKTPLITPAYVQIKVGAIDKILAIFKERYWHPAPRLNEFLPYTPDAHYQDVALDWTHAYGGEGYALNPQGQGRVTHKSALYDEVKRIPLPQVENPQALLTQPFPKKDELAPASFAPLKLDHPLRWQYMDTAAWAKAYPTLPDTTNVVFFQQALPDQCQQAAFKANEAFTLVGMSESEAGLGMIEGQLPNVNLRMFVRTATGRFHELATRADTLWFLPDYNLGVLLFRAEFLVEGWNANLIDTLMIAQEEATETKELSHYYQVFAQLTGPERHLYQVKQHGLQPQKTEVDPLAPVKELQALRKEGAALKQKALRQLPKTANSFKQLSPAQLRHLQNTRLISEDLSHYDLRAINFSGKILHKVDFSGANLTSCHFDNARLEEVNFNQALMEEVYFRQAQLTRCNFYRNQLKAVNFKLAEIKASAFTHTALTEVNLDHAHIGESQFIKSTWQQLRANNLWIEASQFQETHCQDVLWSYAQLKHTHFHNSQFTHNDFCKTMTHKLNFTGAQTRFEHCRFAECQWREANFLNSVFKNIEINVADFHKSEWRAARLSTIICQDSDFSGNVFTDAELEQSHFKKNALY